MKFIRQHKNPFIVLVILIFAATVYAADTLLQDMTAAASAAADDIFYLVNDPNGVPANRKIGFDELQRSITAVGTIATGTWNASFSNDIVKDAAIDWGSGANQVDMADIPGGVAPANNFDFGGADFELPQASPAAPDADGEIELDFTDGSLVVQHGSAHAELGGSTDVVMGKLIHSFTATLAFPDLLQAEIDNWPLKAIESTQFPHGVVITDIHLKVSDMSGYDLNVENWDDPNTINAGNGTIDNIVCTAHSQDENSEDTITYSTIAAGQIIMLDLPTTNVSWIYIQVEYYEPIA